jgi:hypothetical protein
MDRLGYIKNIQEETMDLGGSVLEIIPLKNIINPLNPTACYVIEPPLSKTDSTENNTNFCVPGTDFCLKKCETYMVSKDTGLLFPTIDNVPILTNRAAILATAKF